MIITTLPYQANSVNLFSAFAHLPYACLLDSCCDGQAQGRYDIIVAEPIRLLKTASTFFADMRTALSNLKKILSANAATANDLPFTVGLLGYLSYDMGRYLESIPTLAQADSMLPDAIAGIYDWSIVQDHQKKQAYLITLNDAKKNSILRQLQQLPTQYNPFSLISAFQANMSQASYKKSLARIKQHFVDGDCYQVNFAQRFSASFTGDPWHAYQYLRSNNPAPFSAFIRLPNATILSCSPEAFLQVKQNKVRSKPIKGTAKRFSDPKADCVSADTLLRSEKDRAENVMIVDLLRNDVSRSCVAGSVQVPTLCALESFANVHHLVSTIEGTLKADHTPIDLLQHCFPGGSITGAPKIAAMRIIEALEPHRRSVYCGSIFYCDVFDQFDSNITIRTVLCERDKIHCYAGGGIIYDSDPAAEYEECLAKVGNILRLLAAGQKTEETQRIDGSPRDSKGADLSSRCEHSESAGSRSEN